MSANHGFVCRSLFRPQFTAARNDNDRSAMPVGYSDNRYAEQQSRKPFKLDEEAFKIWRAYQ